MKITLEIPEEMANELKLPDADLDAAFRKEVAYALYGRGIASFGIARKLAQVSKWEFIEGLRERHIPRQFDEAEWEAELTQMQNADNL